MISVISVTIGRADKRVLKEISHWDDLSQYILLQVLSKLQNFNYAPDFKEKCIKGILGELVRIRMLSLTGKQRLCRILRWFWRIPILKSKEKNSKS